MESNSETMRLQLVTDLRNARAHFLIVDVLAPADCAGDVALCGDRAAWHSTRVAPLAALCPACVAALFAVAGPAPRAGGPLT